MKELQYDLVVVGGGCAGMAAAAAASDRGVRRIALLERGAALGGVLRQCIHNGFGVHHFGEDLTGVEYAERFAAEVRKRPIDVFLSTMVLSLDENKVQQANQCNKKVSTDVGEAAAAEAGERANAGIAFAETEPRKLTNAVDGFTDAEAGEPTNAEHHLVAFRCGEMLRIAAGAVILAAGCRERPRGALLLPGTRPAGVMTAGTAQRYLNLEGYLVGKRIVILGSGDIGLIMARQFVLEGAEVLAVCEVMPYSSGLTRNIVQCLEDFEIPLYFNTTVTEILGGSRVTAVKIAEVDSNRNPISGTEKIIECDSLVLSVGLIPENELAEQAGIALDAATGGARVDERLETEKRGIFACGNALHVHDLADFAAMEGSRAGENAAAYLCGSTRQDDAADTRQGRDVLAGFGVRGLVPQCIRGGQTESVQLQFRPAGRYTNCAVAVHCGQTQICRVKKTILTPGEMCTLTLPETEAEGDLTVSVEVRA